MMLAEIERRHRERFPRAFGEVDVDENSGGSEPAAETAAETKTDDGTKTVGAKVPAAMRERLKKLRKSRGMKSISEALVYAAAKGLDGLGI